MTIQSILAKEISDSKGHPTIEATVLLDDGSSWTAASPSGASTGTNEAVELPVHEALQQIQTKLAPALVGKNCEDQRALDTIILSLDATPDKHVLGGNATTAVSMALVKAVAHSHTIPLYRYIQEMTKTPESMLPVPYFLAMEGGKHGDWVTDIQEFMIVPNGKKYPTFKKRFDVCNSVFENLETILKEKNYPLSIGFEGAFSPKGLTSNEEALELLTKAIEKALLVPGSDMSIAIDAAASEFFENGSYVLKSENGKRLTPDEWMNQILFWSKTYPILSYEDMFHEDQWQDWTNLTAALGESHFIVGDDLVTTSVAKINKAITEKAMNSCIIKVNQIGTISEACDAVAAARSANFTTVVSHRGGETADDTIADFAVGTSSYCKFGGPRHEERMAKYNRLLKIEEELQ